MLLKVFIHSTLLIIFLISIFSINESYSQIKIGVEGSYIPYVNSFKKGYGGSISLKYMLANEHLGIGFTTGYDVFRNNFQNYWDVKLSVIPIVASFEYYISNKRIKPFIGVDIGLHKTEYQYNDHYHFIHLKMNKIAFGLRPYTGIAVGIFNNFDLSFSVKYSAIWQDNIGFRDNWYYLSLNLGMAYTFNK